MGMTVMNPEKPCMCWKNVVKTIQTSNKAAENKTKLYLVSDNSKPSTDFIRVIESFFRGKLNLTLVKGEKK